MLSNFSRSVLEEKRDYMVFIARGVPLAKRCNAILDAKFDYLTDEDKEILRDFIVSKKLTGHGCFVETATAYGLYPHLVRLDKMTEEDGHNTHRFDEFAVHGLETPFTWMANYPNSYTGEPHPINERIARAMVDVEVAAVAKTIKFLKEETVSDEYLKEWSAKQK
jgi:creatinine amidohydrolase/Fe(II)-dependent formamide hydrolase-like protein